jgi:hypothetical protein
MVEILDVALLRLRFQSSCGLDLDLNLPLLNTHSESVSSQQGRVAGLVPENSP